MSRIVVFKKYRPKEGRIFVNEKTANAFMKRVKKAGGAKLIKMKIKR